MATWRLIDTLGGDSEVEAAIRGLFAGDGTVYLVTGFFTGNAYRLLRDDIEAFLERSPENELVVLANPAADQLSKWVIRDLRRLGEGTRLHMVKYPYGFLHAKLYVRDGPDPIAIIGSANLTRGAFEYNLELGLVIEGDGPDDPDVARFVEWVDEVLNYSRPIKRRDKLLPIRVAMTLSSWLNKGRLLPPIHVAGRMKPIFLLFFGVLLLSWLV